MEVSTNEKAVTRIVSLLLENAGKFTEKGSVILRVVPKQNFICFIVEDSFGARFIFTLPVSAA